jgi:transposase
MKLFVRREKLRTDPQELRPRIKSQFCAERQGTREIEIASRACALVAVWRAHWRRSVWRSYGAVSYGEELEQRQLIQARIASVEEKLNAIGEADKRVQLLRTIPGVGPRLAEAIVALLDQPQRFP